jgi:hypothetical protein
MIHGRSVALRLEVLNRIQVGNVNPASVGSRAVLAVFVHVQREKKGIHTVNLLEQSNALSPNRENGGASFAAIVLSHLHTTRCELIHASNQSTSFKDTYLIANVMPLVNIRHNTNSETINLFNFVKTAAQLLRPTDVLIR